jgi:hypothetical protein
VALSSLEFKILWSGFALQTRMVKPFSAQLPKLTTRVRFPSPAPVATATSPFAPRLTSVSPIDVMPPIPGEQFIQCLDEDLRYLSPG